MKVTVKNITMSVKEKYYFYFGTAAMTLLAGQSAYAAPSTTADKLQCTNKSWNVPPFLITLKNMIEEPVSWLQMGSLIVMPFLLILIFFKFKGAKGRPEKLEDAYKLLYWSIGIDIAILSVSWVTSWVLSKLC